MIQCIKLPYNFTACLTWYITFPSVEMNSSKIFILTTLLFYVSSMNHHTGSPYDYRQNIEPSEGKF